MGKEKASEEMEKERASEELEIWRDYMETLREFKDTFGEYVRNERALFEASQERNEDLKDFVQHMANTIHGLLAAVNRLIEINYRLVDWNQTLHRIIMECMAEEAEEEQKEATSSEDEK